MFTPLLCEHPTTRRKGWCDDVERAGGWRTDVREAAMPSHLAAPAVERSVMPSRHRPLLRSPGSPAASKTPVPVPSGLRRPGRPGWSQAPWPEGGDGATAGVREETAISLNPAIGPAGGCSPAFQCPPRRSRAIKAGRRSAAPVVPNADGTVGDDLVPVPAGSKIQEFQDVVVISGFIGPVIPVMV